MISIGAMYGGPEHEGSAIDKIITAAMNAAMAARGDWTEGTSPGVNVVFYVSGSVVTHHGPEKIEAARYSRKQRLLLVAVPMPPDVADAGGSIEFIVHALRQANGIAAEIFAKKGTEPVDAARAEAIVTEVEATLRSQIDR